MASIFYTTPYEKDKNTNPFYIRFNALADNDKYKIHTRAEDPASADIILFVEPESPYFEIVKKHPLTKTFPEKTFVLCQTDKFIAFLPGLYTSLENKRHKPGWTGSFNYFGIKEEAPLSYDKNYTDRKYLFSFLGSFNTSPVRKKMKSINYDQAIIEDVANLKVKKRSGSEVTKEQFSNYRERYCQILNDSHFVLCPRGFGTSSFRLFESMLMGRPPVIISDQWVEPKGPDWDEFSIRIKERDVMRIPDILEERKSISAEMGIKAREAWEEWFSDEVSFHRIAEWLLDIKKAGITGSKSERILRQLQLFTPYHFLRYLKRKIA